MREKFTDQRQRLAGISQLPAHQHHQAKAEEQERETAQTVLNPDHFVVGGENIFSPPPELVVLVFASVRVWIVMRFDGSRRIHFRRKLSFQYLEGSAVCKVEKVILAIEMARSRHGGRAVVARTRDAASPRLQCSTISISAPS